MPVKDADPQAKTLDEAFGSAMTGPAKPREPASPPAIDPDAPHGRDPATGEPKAPYGLTRDGKPRRSNAGRRPAGEQPRVISPDKAAAAAADDTPGAPLEGKPLEARDYSAALMESSETIWFGASMLAKFGPRVPLVGRFVPGEKIAATAVVFNVERPRLAAALNLAAQHDARARRLAERLSGEDVSWMLSCMFMTVPFVSVVGAVWGGDPALTERELPPLRELAARNDQALEQQMARIKAQMERAQALAAAEQQQADPAAAAAAAGGAGQNEQAAA